MIFLKICPIKTSDLLAINDVNSLQQNFTNRSKKKMKRKDKYNCPHGCPQSATPRRRQHCYPHFSISYGDLCESNT